MKDVTLSLESVLALGREAEIHSFLERHPFLFDFLSTGGFLRSKMRLADSYVPDFVAVGHSIPRRNDLRPRVTLIEIERANSPLFTRSGDPTSFLTHAIRQVQDWKRWITDNRSYSHSALQKIAEEEIPLSASRREVLLDVRMSLRQGLVYGFHDDYLVVAGRRTSMTISDRLRLAQMNDNMRDVQVITYDVLLDLAGRADLYAGAPPG